MSKLDKIKAAKRFANMITIEPIMGKAELGDFVQVPFYIYKYDDNWVAPLRAEQYKELDRTRNPFYDHAEAEFWVARRGRTPVGRIAAIVDEMWEEIHGEKAAYFGYFECENDQPMANALFDAAVNWAQRQGCTRIFGPMSPNQNGIAGMLIDGFDDPPMVMMAYNPPHYAQLVENYSFSKWKDLYAWKITGDEVPERLAKVVGKLEQRGRFTVRKLDMSDWTNEVTRAREMFNSYEQVNNIYTPLTPAEFDNLADDLKMIVDPDLTFFAEVEGKTVGFSIAIPDANIAIKAANGRLFPIGIIKLLLAKKNIDRLRVMAMGVIEGYHGRGIDLVFYYNTYVNGLAKGYHMAELSWVDEDNDPMNNTARKMGAELYKTYRIYEYKI